MSAPAPPELTTTGPRPICPFLIRQTADLPQALLSAVAHRCAAAGVAAPVSEQHQRVFCLTPQHRDCSRYLAVARQPLAPAARRSRQTVIVSVAALAAAAVAAVVAVLVIGNPFTAEPITGDVTQSAASVPPTAAGPAMAQTAPPIAATPSPVAPTPNATAATASPRPSPTPTVYTVRPGDSLTALAARFGVSVPALAAANGLTPTAQLRIDQTLIVPPPAVASTPTPP